ncbi:MAG: hypothetical protein AAGC73_07340 [Verrucomicrobiota bacterium]
MLIELPNAFGDATTNMAIDAMLLAKMPAQHVAFRHYGWLVPTITFGYTQTYSEIAQIQPDGVALCRRLTGGGVVDHRNDWTYCLILGHQTEAAQTPSIKVYAQVHRAIQFALNEQQIQAQLAPCPRQCDATPEKPPGPDQCFQLPVANDVLNQQNQKIAGAAMKRNRNGILIQGSIDRASLPEAFNAHHFQKTFIRQLTETLQIELGQSDDLQPLFNGPMIAEEKSRFQSKAWLQRR